MRSVSGLVFAAILAGCGPATSGAAIDPVVAPSPSAMPTPGKAAESANPSPSAPTHRIAFQQGGNDPGVYTIDSDGDHRTLVLAGAFGTPKWSPDGIQLAIYAEKPDGSVVPALVRPDGTGYRELPLEPGLACGLAVWAPDGARVALECWDDHDERRTGIYLIAVGDGSGLRQITTGHGLPGQISADGRRLLFVRDTGTGTTELRIVGLDGRDERTVSSLDVGQMPGFLPGDDAIYAVAEGVIDILDLSGRQLRTLAAPEPKIREARLSPDGREFALIYDPLAVPSPGLYRMPADGSGVTAIAQSWVRDRPSEHPDWAP